MREMQALVRNYVLNRDRQMKYLAVLIALSLFVSFMVPFILMRPADSMSEAATCEIEEHEHSVEAGCYQLFCTPEEGVEHVHSDLCYGLICEKIVHTHTDKCYPNKPDFSALFNTIYDPENLKASANGTNYANSPRDRDSEYKAPPGSILGVATHFHIFAESVSLQSHVHGNIATNWLLQNGAFGVYNDRLNGMSSINYIRNLGPNANLDNAYQTQLIMGSNYHMPPFSNPPFSNRYGINDKKTRRTYYIPKDKFPARWADGYVEPQVKFERPDRPYINITKELDRFAQMSLDLVDAAGPVNAEKGVSIKQGYTVVISDQNGNFADNYNPYANPKPNEIIVKMQGENLTLDFSNVTDKYIYFTIDATEFGMVAPWSTFQRVMHVKGITEDKFLFLNVDVGTNPNAYFNKSWLVYESDDQNSTYGTGEVTLGEGGTRVLYNIVSSDGNGGNYKAFEGEAVFGERRNGSVLAPNADVNVAGNTNGTIIARNFVATGESHRCDVQQEGTERYDTDWKEPAKPTTPVKPEPKKISVQVEKKWNGTVPNQSIEIELYKAYQANLNVDSLSNPVQTITLNSGNSWKHTFSDLLATEGTNKLYYYVKEKTALYNYTTTYNKNGISESDADKKVVITNTEKKLNVSVVKKWEGSAAKPDSVKFRLYRSYEPGQNVDVSTNNMTWVSEITLSASNWSGKFENLPVCDSDNGKTYYYYVKEVSQLSDFNTTYSGNGISLSNGTVTVTNTSIEIPTEPPTEPVLVDVSVEKKWKGDVAANEVTVGLYKGYAPNQDVNSMSGTPIETYTLSSGNNWKHTFANLRAYDDNGNTLYYYIKEETTVPNYTTSYNGNGISVSDGKVTVTNTENKKISVTAKKFWENEEEVVEPTQKTYKIMPIGDSITEGDLGGFNFCGGYRKYLYQILTENKKRSIDMVGSRVDKETEFAEYNGITFDSNHEGYGGRQSYVENGKDSLYHELQNNASIKEKQPDIVVLMAGTNDNGANVHVDEYEKRMHTLLDYIWTELPRDSVVFLASIPPCKYYSDQVEVYNDRIKKIAESYANSGKDVRFVDAGSWVAESWFNGWSNDQLHPNEIGYEIMGRNWATVIDDYINEIDPKPISNDKSKVQSITVNLYKSTNPNLNPTNEKDVQQMTLVQENVTLNADNWTHTFDNLYAKDENNAQTLYYYVVEQNVPKNYTVSYQNNAVNTENGTVSVINTRKELMDINLTKDWVGDSSKKNDEITVTLYSSTIRNLDMTVSNQEFNQLLDENKLKKVEDVAPLTFKAGQQASFIDLPVRDANGQMIYYYVREEDVDRSQFKPSYSKNPVYGGDIDVTITNTKTIDIPVTKTWQPLSGNVPNTTVTVKLYKYKHIPAKDEMSFEPTLFIPKIDEEKDLVGQYTITGNGTVTFNDLPVEEDGYKLFYYVKEEVAEDIAKEYDTLYGTEGNNQLIYPAFSETHSKQITNKEKAMTEISISVLKHWNATDFVVNDDGNNELDDGTDEYYVQDSVNPVEQWADPIKVTLQYSTDRKTWHNYDLTDKNYVNVEFYDSYTFTNLPKERNGAPLYYKVIETYNYGYVTTYEPNFIKADDYDKTDPTPVISLTNTLLKRTLQVKKNWYNNISSGIDKIVVSIYRKTKLEGDRPDLGVNPMDGTYKPVDYSLIINSFDDGTAQGWTEDGAHDRGNGAKSGLQTAVKFGESGYSYGLVSNGAYGEAGEGRDYCAVIQKTFSTVEMVPGQKYTISAKATRTSGPEVYMALLVKNGDTLTEIARTPAISGTGTWQTATCEYTVPENATGTTLVVAPITGDGAMGTMMYIDDIRIQLMEDTPIFHGSFETGNDGWNAAGGQAERVTDQKYAGAYSMESSNRTADWNGIQKVLDASQFVAGNTYDFSAYVRYDGSTGEMADTADVKMTLVYTKDGNTEYATVAYATVQKDTWVKLENSNYRIPDGATDLQLKIEMPGSLHDFYVDEVIARLVETGSQDTPTQPTVNENWTFENNDAGGWQLTANPNPSSGFGTLNESSAYQIWSLDMIEYKEPNVLSELKAGNTYSLSADADRRYYAKMVINYSNNTSSVIYGRHLEGVTTTTALGTLGGEFTVPPGTTVTSIQIGVDGRGTTGGLGGSPLIVDNIKLEQVTDIANAVNIPVNSTFENGLDGWDKVNQGATLTTKASGVGSEGNALSIMHGTEGGVRKSLDTSQLKAGDYKFTAMFSRAAGSASVPVEIQYSINGQTKITVARSNTQGGSWITLSGTINIPENPTSVELYAAFMGIEKTNNEGNTYLDYYLGSDLFIDNVKLERMAGSNIATPAAQSKPRTPETFFTNRSQTKKVTKSTLNIQKMTNNKLAKKSENPRDYWYDTEIVASANENSSPSIIEFDTFKNGIFVGDTVRHLEVQLYDKVAFPSELNIWLQGTGDFGGSNWKTSYNTNGIVHTFAKELTIKAETYMRVFTKKPEYVKRITLTFTNGTTLTINNTTHLIEEAKVKTDNVGPDITGCNYSKDVALKNVLSESSGSGETQDPTQAATEAAAGEWVAAWDLWGDEISDTTNSINARWAGKIITSATVYFSKDYEIDNTVLNKDREAVNNNLGTAIVEKFGMYLLVNAYNNGGKDRNYNGAEVKVSSVSVDKSDAQYDRATLTFASTPTINAMNVENQKNNLTTAVIKTANNLKVKAIVLNSNDGQKWLINNTAYSHTGGITSDIRYHNFTPTNAESNNFSYDTGSNGQQNLQTRWPQNLNEALQEIDVYFKKGVVKQATLDQQFKISSADYKTVTFDKSDPVYDVARYTYYTTNANGEKVCEIWPSQLNTINGTTTVENAIYQVVLTSNVGSKFVISNTAYAENNDNNLTPDHFEKWYPFAQSNLEENKDENGNYTPRLNNVILTIDDLGRDFAGKTIESMHMYINQNVTSNTTPGGMGTNTFLQDDTTGNSNGKFESKGQVGTSKEDCRVFDGAIGLCNIFYYNFINKDNQVVYDGNANAAFNGANAYNPWIGDRLNIQTANPTDISRVIVTFTDGTTYTVWNMNYKAPEEEKDAIHYGHKTSFVKNGANNLFTDATTINRYKDKPLDYIIVSYGEDGEKFLSIPRDMLELNGSNVGAVQSIGEISITHNFDELPTMIGPNDKGVCQDVLKILEDIGDPDSPYDDEKIPDDFTLENIREVKMFFKDNIDGKNSTYTITNTDYSPMAPAPPPMTGNQPALNGDYVYVTDLVITKGANGVWTGDMDGLPVTDGQGNLYEYLVVEKAVYGKDADRYQLISYEHPEGLPLDDDDDNDTIKTSLLNSSIDDENGPLFMPSTGGEGRTVYYLAGIALMLCGIAGCYGMKHWQRNHR